ncbi:hypothetical protein HDV00_012104 [Rhizophlyctis rosea]|nr:hypothetical protein HDV00_012104 [Rhizophlyctis rosea]
MAASSSTDPPSFDNATFSAPSSSSSSHDLPPSYTPHTRPKAHLITVTPRTGTNFKPQLSTRQRPHLANITHIACIKEKPDAIEVVMTAGPFRGGLSKPVISSSDFASVLSRCGDEFIVFPNKHRKRTAIRAGNIIQIAAQGWNETKVYYFTNEEDEGHVTVVMASVEEVGKSLDVGYVEGEKDRDKRFVANLIE